MNGMHVNCAACFHFWQTHRAFKISSQWRNWNTVESKSRSNRSVQVALLAPLYFLFLMSKLVAVIVNHFSVFCLW